MGPPKERPCPLHAAYQTDKGEQKIQSTLSPRQLLTKSGFLKFKSCFCDQNGPQTKSKGDFVEPTNETETHPTINTTMQQSCSWPSTLSSAVKPEEDKTKE